MSALLIPKNGQSLGAISSTGHSTEHYKIVEKASEARIQRLETVAWKYNASFYLFSSLDIAEFENRVEEIRDELMEGRSALTKEDVNILKQLLKRLDTFRLMGVARLIAPLLEMEAYSQEAASIIKSLLKHPKAKVRYSALEAISFALGEVSIAEELLAEAKNLLKDEETTFVREYLESL